MIVTRLLGGLGNQLFQYATGRAMSLRSGRPHWLDTRGYDAESLRGFALRPFGLPVGEAPPEVLAALPPMTPGTLPAVARRLARADLLPGRLQLYLEPTLGPFDQRLTATRASAYLVGFWQSEKYFSDVADVLRQELALPAPTHPISERLLGEMRAGPSVSLHVRRGDYVSDPKTAAVHGACDLGYYERAMRLVQERMGPSVRWYAFSDDPAWVRQNLAMDRLTVVDHHAPNEVHEDLRLMSACSGHIIANSSLSWWGAWLGRPDDVVVAPRRWFNDSTHDARDVVPDRWLQA